MNSGFVALRKYSHSVCVENFDSAATGHPKHMEANAAGTISAILSAIKNICRPLLQPNRWRFFAMRMVNERRVSNVLVVPVFAQICRKYTRKNVWNVPQWICCDFIVNWFYLCNVRTVELERFQNFDSQWCFRIPITFNVYPSPLFLGCLKCCAKHS